MKFHPNLLPPSCLIELDKKSDSRGYFAREFCSDEFSKNGLESFFPQSNLCFNKHKGTLRGLHAQSYPFQETKVVRCLTGQIFDVIVDMRQDSESYLKHYSAILSAENSLAMYVPEGFYHGYQVLADDSLIHYHVSRPYSPAHEVGLSYCDPALDIKWPLKPCDISKKDLSWPLISS